MNIDVSVAILINAKRQVLLAERPSTKSWEGWWEFPGGKIEKNETPVDALSREIYEEIGVYITKFEKWVTRRYSFEGNNIILNFFKVNEWEGQVTAKEKQKLVWANLKKTNTSPILPANNFVEKALDLPKHYAITNLSETSKEVFFNQLQKKIIDGLSLIQVREKNLSLNEFKIFSKEVIKMCQPKNIKVIINSDINLAYDLKADGVHITSKELHKIKDLPKGLIVGASCHTVKDIYIAEKLKVDFIVLSSVKKTLSHPEIEPIGWQKFQKLVNNSNIPAYALGGLGVYDYEAALENGAVGVASQRLIWK